MPEVDAKSFATLLRLFRHERHLTQEELAERSGVSLGAISLLERALTQAPQRGTVELLATALDLDTEETAAFVAATRQWRWTEALAKERESAASQTPADEARSTGLPGETLPNPLTPLFGRARDAAVVLSLLQDPIIRLVTLTGPAGVGKTRLALTLAATLRRERRQDVVFVDLIPVREPERALPTIAQALGVRESDSVPLREAILHALRDRDVLLVLDNFEQALPAARAVLDLLIARPRVKALVTSRVSLNVRGEHIFSVAPLALPDPAHMDSLATLLPAPTVALFLDRAAAAWPDFTITTLTEGLLVAEICVRLDGLPLAIELAAARVRHVGLRQLHGQLATPAFLGVLAGGPQDLADHQRTMRSTIAWSYDLLGDTERRLFRWLGVFVGGGTHDALAAVTGAPNDALSAGLTALGDASLLQWNDVAGMRRCAQLVMLRTFAEECLRASGEWDEARRRHADYFLELAELSFLANWDQLEDATSRVEADYENLRAALFWAWETGATLHGLRMAGALRRFWDARSYFLEGLAWLERFIGRAKAPQNREEQTALAEAWTGVVVMAYRLDRFEQSRDAGETALALQRELGDKTAIAGALNNLANPVSYLRDFERAQALYEEALAIHREIQNRQGQVFPLLNLGEVYYVAGKPREALAYYEQSIAISREIGESDYARGLTWNNVGEAYILLDEPARAIEVTEPNYQLFMRERSDYFAATCAFTLGRAHWRLGDVVATRAHLDEAERLFRNLGNLTIAARVLYFRASLALEQEDIAAARRDLTHAFEDLTGQSRERENIWRLVERAGTLANRRGSLERATRLYGAAIAHRDETSPPAEPAELQIRARDLHCLHARFGEKALEILLLEGKALSSEAATSLAQQELLESDGGRKASTRRRR